MKLTPTTKRKAGMTLLELTVVILVLLSLISILFIGARAWKKGSDRAASILQIRNVQQAVRSHSNMYGKNPGDTDANLRTSIFGADKFIKTNPTTGSHPAGSGFSYSIPAATTIPAIGTLYMTVTGGKDVPVEDFIPSDHADW
jgi:type II secretory pathway pseudopilin PulG